MLITEVTGLDLDDERLTPNLLAERCEAKLAELLGQRDTAKTKLARRNLNSRIHSTRVLLRWARSRAGYVQPQK